jgi:hypothetical protein
MTDRKEPRRRRRYTRRYRPIDPAAIAARQAKLEKVNSLRDSLLKQAAGDWERMASAFPSKSEHFQQQYQQIEQIALPLSFMFSVKPGEAAYHLFLSWLSAFGGTFSYDFHQGLELFITELKAQQKLHIKPKTGGRVLDAQTKRALKKLLALLEEKKRTPAQFTEMSPWDCSKIWKELWQRELPYIAGPGKQHLYFRGSEARRNVTRNTNRAIKELVKDANRQ